VGLSKIPHSRCFCEDASTRKINRSNKSIQEALDPLGVAVVIEAQHMCMQMRGIQKQNSVTTTSSFTGAFEKQN
jgi:GTP cyclohydrolase I